MEPDSSNLPPLELDPPVDDCPEGHWRPPHDEDPVELGDGEEILKGQKSHECIPRSEAGLCDDLRDNDRDGLTDCDDPDCADDPACARPDEECETTVDDAGAEVADCEAPACADHPSCEEDVTPEEICDDGIDNSGNGRVDCEDEACAEAEVCRALCDPWENHEGGHLLAPGGRGHCIESEFRTAVESQARAQCARLGRLPRSGGVTFTYTADCTGIVKVAGRPDVSLVGPNGPTSEPAVRVDRGDAVSVVVTGRFCELYTTSVIMQCDPQDEPQVGCSMDGECSLDPCTDGPAADGEGEHKNAWSTGSLHRLYPNGGGFGIGPSGSTATAHVCEGASLRFTITLPDGASSGVASFWSPQGVMLDSTAVDGGATASVEANDLPEGQYTLDVTPDAPDRCTAGSLFTDYYVGLGFGGASTRTAPTLPPSAPTRVTLNPYHPTVFVIEVPEEVDESCRLGVRGAVDRSENPVFAEDPARIADVALLATIASLAPVVGGADALIYACGLPVGLFPDEPSDFGVLTPFVSDPITPDQAAVLSASDVLQLEIDLIELGDFDHILKSHDEDPLPCITATVQYSWLCDDDDTCAFDCRQSGCSDHPLCDDPAPTEEICDNEIDDDGNGLVDCNDPQCAEEPFCDDELGPEDCSNLVDDNGDGLVDCDDPQCFDDPLCDDDLEPEDCWNLEDDNGDGRIDCDDPQCSAEPHCQEPPLPVCDGSASVGLCGSEGAPIYVSASTNPLAFSAAAAVCQTRPLDFNGTGLPSIADTRWPTRVDHYMQFESTDYEEIDLTGIESIGRLTITSNPNLRRVIAPDLVHVGNLIVSSNPLLEEIDLGGLACSNNQLAISSQPVLTTLDLSALARTRNISIRDVGLVSLSLPALEELGEFVNDATAFNSMIGNMPALNSFSAPMLARVRAELALVDMGVSAISLPALQRANQLRVEGNPNLTTLSLPAFNELGARQWLEDDPIGGFAFGNGVLTILSNPLLDTTSQAESLVLRLLCGSGAVYTDSSSFFSVQFNGGCNDLEGGICTNSSSCLESVCNCFH